MSDSIEREQGSYLLAIIILMIVGFALMIADVKTYQPVSYTHLTLPTNSRV